MKNLSSVNGPQVNRDGNTVSACLAALSTEQYRSLVGFARYRLRVLTNSRWLQQCLALSDGEELVAHCLLKLELGEVAPSLGRRLRRRNRTSTEAFMACVKGMINGDLHRLIAEAWKRSERFLAGDSVGEPSPAGSPALEPPCQTLSRQDLHHVLFHKLYSRLALKPARASVVREWARGFLDDDWELSEFREPNPVARLREVAGLLLVQMEAELSPANDGMEVLL